VSENMTDDTAKGNARRRLVRGVFAAPAALTLYSGSVAASSLSCVAKQVGAAVNAEVPSGNTWVRVRQYVIGAGSSSNNAKFVRGSEIASLLAPGGQYLTGETNYQCVSSSLSGFTPGITYTNPTQGSQGPVLTDPVEFIAVRVNSTGFIEGVQGVYTSTGASALHTSCWTSFGGAIPFNPPLA